MKLETNNTTSNIKVLAGNGKATSKYVTKILKPYIKESKNILFQSDIDKENTKYIIKYNFDLDGKEITIPKNCIIEFDGGSFSNGTIIFNDTYLTFYGGIEEVLIDIEVKGTYIEAANSLSDKLDTTDGMGKIYLKKNKTIQEQMKQPNTIYVVQYDFDLGGKELVVPENCVLEFDGGMLKNGGVTFNNNFIEAGLYKIFDVITLSGNLKNADIFVEWFGASHIISDNAPLINKCIEEANKLDGRHNVVLSSLYTIKDTIWLRNKTSIKGKTFSTVFQTAAPVDSMAASGFLVDFENREKYVIDSYITVNGSQYNVPYNNMWTVLEEIPGYKWSGNRTTGCDITDITIQIKQSAIDRGPVFGGIRLLGKYYSTIRNVSIAGTAVGISFNNAWVNTIDKVALKTCLCGFYFGHYCTTNDLKSCVVNEQWYNGDYEWTGVINWKDEDRLFPPYDIEGRKPEDNEFSGRIKIKSAGIICESNRSDNNKIVVYDCAFEQIDAALLDGGGGSDVGSNITFISCYDEGVRKVLIWTFDGNVKWINPKYGGSKNIYPYVYATESGEIESDGHTKGTCYPYYMADANGKTYAKYIIKDGYLLYDRYEKNESDRRLSIPIDFAKNKVFPRLEHIVVGFIYTLSNESDDWIPTISSGLTHPTSFKNALSFYDLNEKTCVLDYGATDFSADGTIINEKKIRLTKSRTGVTSAVFTVSSAMKIKDSDITIENGLDIRKSFNIAIDSSEKKQYNLDYIFECYGKNKLTINSYSEEKNFICLAGTDPIDLEINLSNCWTSPKEVLYNADFDTKYKVKVTTRSGTAILTNTVRPKNGIAAGDIFVENGKPIYYDGTKWVDRKTSGRTDQRPTLQSEDLGFEYYDITLKKVIYWSGNDWVDSEGYPADAKRSGNTESRPNLAGCPAGYQYYDTTLSKFISWNGSTWVNVDGTSL